MKKFKNFGLISKISMFVFSIATITTYGGFSRWFYYEPKMPDRVKDLRNHS